MNDCRNEKGMFINKHGMNKTPLYKVWCGMKDRCYNKNNKRYKNYGGNGIEVCKEWKEEFKNFYEWATSNGYHNGLTIDRIDNNGNYEPSNCRWVTHKEQNRNYSRNHKVLYKNKEYCVIELSEKFNIPYQRLLYRLRKGMDIEKALMQGDFRYGK